MLKSERVAPTQASNARIGEVDGLRGLALTLVVIFHLFGHGRVSGGVDVFLTVSGFLLVLSLGRAISAEKPLGIAARWGRTFSRLAPPATIVLLAVTVASFTVLAPWMREQNLLEVVSTALYFENWQLIATQLAYGAAGPETSPLQHFWSLSVQAQFFIGFPIVVVLLTLLVPPGRGRVRSFWVLIACTTIASFIYGWYANSIDPLAAYFDTFARFWEIGAGGIVAGLLLVNRVIPASLRAVAGWLGLAMVLSSGFVFDGAQAYPGPAALLPVGGAALVLLAANGDKASPSPLLRSPVLTYLDRISYGLYLWHWPILIGYLTVRQHTGVGWRGACLVLGLAYIMTILTSWGLRPVNAWAMGKQRKRRALTVMVVAILVASVPAGAALVALQQRDVVHVGLDDCAGAAAMDQDRPECDNDYDAAQIIPALAELRSDGPSEDTCWSTWSDAEFNVCSLGPDGYSRHLVAVGDSHNNQWVDAYERIAENQGWRIDVASRSACAWTHAERQQESEQLAERCARWQVDAERYLQSQGGLDAVIVAESAGARYDSAEARIAGHVSAWGVLNGTKIFAMRDNSMFEPSIMNCVGNAVYIEEGRCVVPREVGLRPNGFSEAVSRVPHARMIDVTDYMCTDRSCPMVIGDVIVSRDGSHLTGTFVETLTPYLEEELVNAFED